MPMFADLPYARNYLLGALEGAPDIFDRLLDRLSEAEADRRPVDHPPA